MYVDDIADMRALRPWVALSVTMERRAIRLGKLLAGELFIHRERVRHAAALLQVIAEEYFRERPSLTRDLVWAVSEFEELEHCEVAGAAVFVAFAEGRAKDDDLVKTVTNSLLDQLALIYQHAIEAMPNASLQLPFEQESQRGLADAHPNTGLHTTPTMADQCSATTGADRPEIGTIDAAADDPRDRGLALLHAAAVKGRVNVCPRGARALRYRGAGRKRFAQPILPWNAQSRRPRRRPALAQSGVLGARRAITQPRWIRRPEFWQALL